MGERKEKRSGEPKTSRTHFSLSDSKFFENQIVPESSRVPRGPGRAENIDSGRSE